MHNLLQGLLRNVRVGTLHSKGLRSVALHAQYSIAVIYTSELRMQSLFQLNMNFVELNINLLSGLQS